ncbi:plasmid partitioning protein RepB C-terminal domain-containing protein [Bradyrhizobium cenepequi]|uniref:plasmid partitioning protein RepB C-terminal domain-containing protein n=1 Tax=Bradyrhizobium cenepequi TaxID=2821403 RepID=UPI00201CABD7|nr:plasmid partitioning protein RepB C-terminal domain-containing protein [Bradyrhizobium cenepequi]
MSPLRQIETAELLIDANNFLVSDASAILAGTPQAQLITPQTPKRLKGMTAEAICPQGTRTLMLAGSDIFDPGLVRPRSPPVCTENLIRVDDVLESPKLAE